MNNIKQQDVNRFGMSTNEMLMSQMHSADDFISAQEIVEIFGIPNPQKAFENELNEELIHTYEIFKAEDSKSSGLMWMFMNIHSGYNAYREILSGVYINDIAIPSNSPVTEENGFKFFFDNYFDSDGYSTSKAYCRGELAGRELKRFLLEPLDE